MKWAYSGIQKLQEFYKQFHATKSKILMFHQVDNNKDSWRDKNCAITQKSFEQLIQHVEAQKKIVLPLRQIANFDNKMFITFDDAFACVYENAYPLLKNRNIPFTVFLTYDFIDTPGYLTSGMVNTLASETLCTIGAHSISHPLLRFCQDEQAKKEILKSKTMLEEKLGKRVHFFAYPYGSVYACSKREIRLVKDAGYEYAFSTLNASLDEKSVEQRFFIPRINVNETNYQKV